MAEGTGEAYKRKQDYRKHAPNSTTTINLDHSTMSKENKDRLPTNVVPVHYHLAVKTDVEQGTFEGKVVIQYVAGIISLGAQLIDMSTGFRSRNRAMSVKLWK
jgi:hypothetical protein